MHVQRKARIVKQQIEVANVSQDTTLIAYVSSPLHPHPSLLLDKHVGSIKEVVAGRDCKMYSIIQTSS